MMEKIKNSQNDSNSLRKRAEHNLQQEKIEIEGLGNVDIVKTIHELRVHQIELEMQNDELLKAQNELEESRSRYSDLFDFAPIGYFVLDKQGKITEANLTGASRLGIERNRLMASPLAFYINDEDKDKFYLNRSKVFKTATCKRLDLRMLCQDNDEFFAELIIDPVTDGSSSKVSHIRIALIDISQRKQAEHKLLIYQEQLRRLSSELSLSRERIRRQVATEIHENIAQNLAIAKLKLDSLSSTHNDLDGLSQAESLIKEALENIRALTLELSVPILNELGLVPAVKWILEDIQSKHNLFTNFFDDGESKPLNKDVRMLLFHTLRELVINVIKHAEAKHLSINILRVNDYIKIEVIDDGKGMDTKKTIYTDDFSCGFGLFSIRESLDYIGGKLEIKSGPGKGTTVILTAPLEIKSTTIK